MINHRAALNNRCMCTSNRKINCKSYSFFFFHSKDNFRNAWEKIYSRLSKESERERVIWSILNRQKKERNGKVYFAWQVPWEKRAVSIVRMFVKYCRQSIHSFHFHCVLFGFMNIRYAFVCSVIYIERRRRRKKLNESNNLNIKYT